MQKPGMGLLIILTVFLLLFTFANPSDCKTRPGYPLKSGTFTSLLFSSVIENITSNSISCIWGLEVQGYGRQLFVSGENGVLFYKKECGTLDTTCDDAADEWLTDESFGKDNQFIYDLWGYSTNQAAAHLYMTSTNGRILHYSQASDRWNDIFTNVDDDIRGVWGWAPESEESEPDFIAVGSSGVILIYAGDNRTVEMDSGLSTTLHGVWGNSSDNVFAVGNDGTILHFDGAGWSAMESGTSSHLMSVWGTSASNVFAAGHNGTILHYDGSTWAEMSTGTDKPIKSIMGAGDDTLFAAGDLVILAYVDGSWEPVETDDTVYWQDVWTGKTGDAYLVGSGGEFLSISASSSDSSSTTTTAGQSGGTSTTAPAGTTTTTSISSDPPGEPRNPYPEDDAADVPVSATLQWDLETAESSDLVFDVYLGSTDAPPLSEGNMPREYFTPPKLEHATTYYWRIVARGTNGLETEGPTWSFTTAADEPCLLSLFLSRSSLNSLRQFRDTTLAKSKTGNTLISLYYKFSSCLLSVFK